MNQWSSLQNFSFSSLSSRSEPTLHKVSLEPPCEATRKDPDPKKIPRTSFGLLNVCAEFQDHISTGSTLTRRCTRPPRFHVWACLSLTILIYRNLTLGPKVHISSNNNLPKTIIKFPIHQWLIKNPCWKIQFHKIFPINQILFNLRASVCKIFPPRKFFV